MNDAYRTLLTYISNNDLTRARDVAKVILRGSTTAKDKDFCEKLLKKMGEQDEKGLEIPYNLKSIIQTKCTAYEFSTDRYFLSEREEAVLAHIRRMYAAGARLEKIGIHYTNAVLLHGLSGTGKTTFAQYVAKDLGLPFLYVSITQMMDSLMGKTGQNMDRVFEFASSIPCVLVLDEIDQIGTKRGEEGGISGEMKRVLISILQSLDKLPNNVVLIAATNRPDALDEALVRRFPLKHKVEPLNAEESCRFVEKYLNSTELQWVGNVSNFLKDITVSAGSVNQSEAYTPAVITDCLNELLAREFENCGSDDVVVHLGDQKGGAQATLTKLDAPLSKAAEMDSRGRIPDKYCWHKTKGGAWTRTYSGVGMKVQKQRLEEITCPCCGEKDLRIKQFDGEYGEPVYRVGCDNCDWLCPTGDLSDYGETVSDLREWLEAYILLGMPQDRVKEDLTAEFGGPTEE